MLDGIWKSLQKQDIFWFSSFFVTIFEEENWGGRGRGGPFLGIIVKHVEPVAQNPFSSAKIFQKWNSHVEMFSFSQA